MLSFAVLIALMVGIVVFPPLAPIIIMGSLFCCAWLFFRTENEAKIDGHYSIGENSDDYMD